MVIGSCWFASNYGKQQNPAWYYNLKANPRCSTAFHGQRHEMEAYEAEGEERQRLWELDVSVYPPRNHYAPQRQPPHPGNGLAACTHADRLTSSIRLGNLPSRDGSRHCQYPANGLLRSNAVGWVGRVSLSPA